MAVRGWFADLQQRFFNDANLSPPEVRSRGLKTLLVGVVTAVVGGATFAAFALLFANLKVSRGDVGKLALIPYAIAAVTTFFGVALIYKAVWAVTTGIGFDVSGEARSLRETVARGGFCARCVITFLGGRLCWVQSSPT